ncbi:MAG: DUF481 domain-containing protein [Cytophagales bacterium]|nr:MAG: DUF481 domain-containing protein [Cytophagales bacterium]
MQTKLLLLFILLAYFDGALQAQTFTKSQVDSLLKVRLDSALHHVTEQPHVSRPPKKDFHYLIGIDGTVNLGNLNRYLISSRNNFSMLSGKHLWFSLTPYFAFGSMNGQTVEQEITTDLNLTAFYQKSIYALFFMTVEKSNLRAIEWRTLAGLGVGFHWLSNSRISFSISNALTYEQTDFLRQEDINVYRNSSRLRLDYNLFGKKLLFSHTSFFQPALNTRNLRWSNLLNIDFPMRKNFSFRLSTFTTYESITAVGKQSYDTRVTFGVVFKN